MNHWTLSQSTTNSLTVSNKQGSTHSISSETTDYERRVWRVESRNLWVSFSRNASGSLINIVHGSTDRVVGELRTLTSHAGLLPHHSSGEEDSDGSTARSRFIRKIVGTHGRDTWTQACLLKRSMMRMGSLAGLEKGWHGTGLLILRHFSIFLPCRKCGSRQLLP